MKKVILTALVTAAFASQAWAEHCQNLYCEWSAKDCHSINNDYAPNIGKSCTDLIAACVLDGSVFSGVDAETYLTSQNEYGKNVRCGNAGGTWTGQGKDPAYNRGCCVYLKSSATDGIECWKIANDTKYDECVGSGGFDQGNGNGGVISTCNDDGTCPAGTRKPENLVTCCYNPYEGSSGYCGAAPQAECDANSGVVVTSCSTFESTGSCSGSTPIIDRTPLVSGLTVAAQGNALHISSAKEAIISLYTIDGSKVLNGKVNAGNSVFSFGKQKLGVYYAVVQSGAYEQAVKVILK